jgi:hypothetical protein
MGGVLGVAVLAAVFAGHGDYATPSAFASGFKPALILAAFATAIGVAAALMIPRRNRKSASLAPVLQPAT